jgi:DNA polymerase-3 subunit epsilon
VDLSFARILADLELPVLPAHDALNDAVMAGLAYLKLTLPDQP